MHMKRSIYVFTTLLASASSWASEEPVQPVQFESSTKSVSDSTVEVIQYDRTQLEKLLVNSVLNRNAQDREYFMGAVRGVELEFRSFLNDTVYGPQGLKSLSEISTLQGFIQATDFAGAIREYQLRRNLIDTRIHSLTTLVQGNLPSQINFKSTDNKTTMPTYNEFNFDPLVEFYMVKLEEVDSLVRNLAYNIQLPNGNPYHIAANSGQGLSLPKQASKITTAQLRGLKKNSRRLHTWEAAEREVMDSYTRFLREQVQKYMYVYGESERYRWQDKKIQKQLKEEAKMLAEAFWTRSYLRAQYGMPLGAIGFQYKKSWLNWDRIKVTNAALSELLENPVWRHSEYIEMSQNYINALRVTEERSSSIFDGNVSLLGTANNLLNWLYGESSHSMATHTVLQLLAADLYEERLISQAGGKAKMISYYKSRYLVTPADIIYYKGLKHTYDPGESDLEDAQEDFTADVGVASAGGSSLLAHFKAAVDACTIQEHRLNQALDLDKQIAVYEGIADSIYAKRRAKSDL